MSTEVIGAYTAANSIDGANHYLLIQPGNSSTAYNRINRNVFLGVTGQPVDISTSQTLSNKALGNTNTITALDTGFTLQDNSDSTKQAQFQLSGLTTATTRTYTLPDASSTIMDTSSTQTATNKTFTAPTISGGSIDNATVTVDTISGHTTAGNGTVYGLSIHSGVLQTANSVQNTNIQTGIQSSKLSNPYKFFAYRNTTWTTATSAAAIVFNATLFDTGANYSTSTGSFTVPLTGFYEFFITAGVGGSVRALLSIYKNGTEFIRLYDSNTVSAGPLDINGSVFIPLTAADTVQVYLTTGSAVTGGFGSTPYYTTFAGNLVSAT